MMFDLVVIGGGMGGLATAALSQSLGMRTCLLEAHTKLGGCAGYFRRGPYTFDAGATALMGLREGEPLGDLLRTLRVDFETAETSAYRVHLPDRSIDVVSNPTRFLDEVRRVFSGGDRLAEARKRFWTLQGFVGSALFQAASGVPRLPLRAFRDLPHNLRILGVRGLLAAATSVLTVDHVLGILGLRNDREFRSWVAMLLQDTAQAGPETVPFANAAACLQAYRLGMSRPRGGMRALVDGIGQAFVRDGGDLRTAALVDHVEFAANHHSGGSSSPGFEVTTRRRERLQARQVVFNLPLDLAARLLGRPLEGRLAAYERRSRAAWSAFTGYVAIDRSAISDETPLFHQVLQSYDQPIHDGNNVLISLSAPDDEGYGPPEVRLATLSTHTRPSDWVGLGTTEYQLKKAQFRDRLLSAIRRALPGAEASLVHAEFASPRSFQRYTRRQQGAVGGPPVRRSTSNFLAVGSDVLGPGLWLVGDSVFPGQGTMATVLSAIRVVERISGLAWDQIRAAPPAAKVWHARLSSDGLVPARN